MGVISLIAGIKAKALQGQGKIVKLKTDYYRQTNLAEADLTDQKRQLLEAKQIQADFRAEQNKQVEGVAPNKLKNLGKGMAKQMNKGKKKSVMIGVPNSVQNQPVATRQGGIFGGQRNLDVGGNSSPFGATKNLDVGGTGGSPFNIGSNKQKK